MKNTLNRMIILGLISILFSGLASAEDYCVGTSGEGRCYNYVSESDCIAHYYNHFGSYQCAWFEGVCIDDESLYTCIVPQSTTTSTIEEVTTTSTSTTTSSTTSTTLPDCVGVSGEAHCYNYVSESDCEEHYYNHFGSYQCNWVDGVCTDDLYECMVPETTTTTSSTSTSTTEEVTTTSTTSLSSTSSSTTSTTLPDCVGVSGEANCYNYVSESDCATHYYNKGGSYQCSWVNGVCADVNVCMVPTTTTTIPTAPEFGSVSGVLALLLIMPAFAYIVVRKNK
jgi:uncharacterized protein YodC (DUF2158 family)